MWKDAVLDVFKVQPANLRGRVLEMRNKSAITNVMDEIRVRKFQNVLQEYDILSRDARVERNNVRWW